jgi:hypothetical protein
MKYLVSAHVFLSQPPAPPRNRRHQDRRDRQGPCGGRGRYGDRRVGGRRHRPPGTYQGRRQPWLPARCQAKHHAAEVADAVRTVSAGPHRPALLTFPAGGYTARSNDCQHFLSRTGPSARHYGLDQCWVMGPGTQYGGHEHGVVPEAHGETLAPGRHGSSGTRDHRGRRSRLGDDERGSHPPHHRRLPRPVRRRRTRRAGRTRKAARARPSDTATAASASAARCTASSSYRRKAAGTRRSPPSAAR